MSIHSAVNVPCVIARFESKNLTAKGQSEKSKNAKRPKLTLFSLLEDMIRISDANKEPHIEYRDE